MNPRAVVTTSFGGKSPSFLSLNDITGRGDQECRHIIISIPLTSLYNDLAKLKVLEGAIEEYYTYIHTSKGLKVKSDKDLWWFEHSLH